jgi:hypothetical protein
VEDSCEHGIEPSGSIKCSMFLRGCTIGGFSTRAQLYEQVSKMMIMFLDTKHTIRFEGCDYRRGMNWMTGFY